MESRSGRGQPLSQQQLRTDRISALPDDLLLLVLARLRCVVAAARTGVLSRRWCSLWTHLREVVFRGVAFNSLEAALGGISSHVSLLKINVPRAADTGRVRPQTSSIGSLLRAATRLDPEEFVLDLPWGSVPDPVQAELPCFHRATSIKLHSCLFCFNLGVPAGVEFPALEMLSLHGCAFDLNTMLSFCPRLRELKLTRFSTHNRDLKVHSVSLQELTVENVLIPSIDIVAPSLKKVTMSISSDTNHISMLAPMVEKVSWQWYSGKIGVGLWCLRKLCLLTAQRQGQPTSLHIYAYTSNKSYIFSDKRDCTKAIEQHMIIALSVLKIHLETTGHAFGAFVFHLIGMNCIRGAMRTLKVVLGRSKEKEGCPSDCLCQPTNWKTKTIALTALEEMEIDGFIGEDVELLFMSAPMLTRVTVKLSQELSSSNDRCTKLYNIFKVYPFVECCAYLSTGELVSFMTD